MIDKVRLSKLMRMTESVHDAEALTALRMANALLKAASMNWSDILGSPSQPAPSPDYRTPPSKRTAGGPSRYGRPASQKRSDDGLRHTGPEIDPMLDALRRGRSNLSSMVFVASIADFWEKRGYLTTDQYNALKRMHSEQDDRGGRSGRFRF